MSKLPQGSPVINPQNIASGQRGLEALANGLMDVSGKAAEGATALAAERSNALLYTDTGNLQDAKHKAQSSMANAKAPGDIDNAVEEYTKTVKLMQENSGLNKSDQGRFMGYSQSSEDSIITSGINQKAGMLKSINRNNLMGGFKTNLGKYQELLIKNPNEAMAFFQDQKTAFDNAASAGIITIDQHENAMGAFMFMREKATNLLSYANNNIATSFDYNQGTALSGEALSERPTTEAVTKFHQDYNTRTNYSGAVRDMINGRLDVMTYMNFSENERYMFADAMDGYQRAVAMVQSNTSVQLIDERLAKLNTAPGGLLSEGERVERETLMATKNEIEHDFMGYMLKTSAGAKVAENYKMDMIGINNSIYSPEEKQQMATAAFNQSMTSVISLAKTQGIDASMIRPANIRDVQSIDAGFKQGGDPQAILNTVKTYNKDNAPWLANSIKDPREAEIVLALGYNSGNKNALSEPFQQRMILANQKDVSFNGLVQSSKQGTDDNSINANIAAQLSPVMSYLTISPNGGQRNSQMMASIKNYVKYSGLANNDPELHNLKDYVQQGVKLYSDAYPIDSGNNYSFNRNDVNIAPTDIRNLSYMIGREIQNNQIYADKKYTITYSAGDIVAIDQFGSVIYQKPYDRHLLSAANDEWRKQEDAIKKAQENPNSGIFRYNRPLVGGI